MSLTAGWGTRLSRICGGDTEPLLRAPTGAEAGNVESRVRRVMGVALLREGQVPARGPRRECDEEAPLATPPPHAARKITDVAL